MLWLLSLLHMTATSLGHRLPCQSYAPESMPSQFLENCLLLPDQTVPQQVDSSNKLGDNTIKKVFDNSEGSNELLKDRQSELTNNNDSNEGRYFNDNENVPSRQLPLDLIAAEKVPKGYHEEEQLLDTSQNPVSFRLDERPLYDSVKETGEVFASESPKNLQNDNESSESPIPTILTNILRSDSNPQEISEEMNPVYQSYKNSGYRPPQYFDNIQDQSDSYGISPNYFSLNEPNRNSGETTYAPYQDVSYNHPHGTVAENLESDSYEKYLDSHKPLISKNQQKYRPYDAAEDHEFKYQQYAKPQIYLVPEKDSIKHLETDGYLRDRPVIPHKWQKGKVPLIDDERKIYNWNQKTEKLPTKKPKAVWSYWESAEKSHRWVQHRVPRRAKIHQKFNRGILSFDYWFMNQLNNIKKTVPKILLTANEVFAVKQKIRDALKVNDLQMNNDGTVIDAEGSVSSLDNLRLQPIMIVKSLPHDRLYESFDDDPLESHRIEIAPFQSLLVTLKTPRKVLGIIPIRISQSKGRTWQTNEQRSIKKVFPVRRPDLAYRQLSERGPYFEKVNATDDEAPGFRIIGGSFAIGTGIPLSYRGRSDLEDTDLISINVN